MGRFALPNLVAFAAIGAVLSLVMSRQIVTTEERAAVAHAQFVANSILREEITPDDLAFLTPMKGEKYDTFNAAVKARILQYPVVLVKLWRSDGTVIYSNARAIVGRQFQPLEPNVREVFARAVAVARPPRPQPRTDASSPGCPRSWS